VGMLNGAAQRIPPHTDEPDAPSLLHQLCAPYRQRTFAFHQGRRDASDASQDPSIDPRNQGK